jgi:integrase/recombinase XerD
VEAAFDEKMAGLLRQFIKDQELRVTPQTLKTRRRSATRFLMFLAESKLNLPSLEEHHLVRFAEWLRLQMRARKGRKEAKVSALASELSHIRQWLLFCYQQDVILAAQHELITLPRVAKALPRGLTVEEIEAWFGLCDLGCHWGLRDRAFLELAYGTGLRHGELLALSTSDLNLADGLARVEKSKNGHGRVVPVTRRAVSFVERYLTDARPWLPVVASGRDRLWLNSRGRQQTASTMTDRIAKLYAPRLEFGHKLGVHVLRHSFATHLVKGGADVRHVGEMLGHRDLNSTTCYTPLEVDDLKQLLRRHPLAGDIDARF